MQTEINIGYIVIVTVQYVVLVGSLKWLIARLEYFDSNMLENVGMCNLFHKEALYPVKLVKPSHYFFQLFC